jgi:hypothetical protein
VIQEFAKTRPQVKPIPGYARIAIDPDEFYADPSRHLTGLYEKYIELMNKG